MRSDIAQSEVSSGQESTDTTDDAKVSGSQSRVVEVRRKLDKVPTNPSGAVEAVKAWIVRRDGVDSALCIEEAVKVNLAARHVAVPDEILSKGWYAEPRKAGGWVVGFRFISGGQPRSAEWVVDDVRREVKAANTYAEELEWVKAEPSRETRSDRA
ncbi:MAG: hypothetical protein C4318_02350 [Acidimicrobiia bacterium]